MTSFSWDKHSNDVSIGDNVQLAGSIIGTGNTVTIEPTHRPERLSLLINGNDNHVRIGKDGVFNQLRIDIGSRNWKSSGSRLTIGDSFSIAGQSRFLLPNSGNVVEIGNGCMFSNSIVVRAGEYPHLIFDLETGAYLDVSDGIFIGDHVWVGEGVYINKAVSINSECIVGARSVVTKRFDVKNAVIAGNPARIVKENVQWVANQQLLKAYPVLAEAFATTQINQVNIANR